VIPFSLSQIADVVGGTVVGTDVTVTGPVEMDSRAVQRGSLFVALIGDQADGHRFAEEAGRAGAVAVLGSRATALPTVIVEDPGHALQVLAS